MTPMPSPAAPPGATAIQLYTLRDALAADADTALRSIAEIGFRVVEAFDLPTFAEALRSAAPRHGLTIAASHAGVIGDETHADDVLAAARDLGIPLVIQPWTDPGRWESVDGIRRIADELNRAAARAAGLGIRVG